MLTETNTFLCNEATTNTLLFVIFIVSFLFFKIVSKNKGNFNSIKEEKKIKKATKYILSHDEENLNFFMSN